MCNKNAYRTKSDAKEDIKRMEGNSKRSAGMSKNLRKLRPYKCFYCKMWHITSQPKAEERRIRKSRRKANSQKQKKGEFAKAR